MNYIKVFSVAMLIGFFGLLPHLSSASTYYVKTNGNDSAAGTSWATAKQTIQAGVNVAMTFSKDVFVCVV